MLKQKGSSLSQYAIIIAIVILGCLLGFSFLGQNIKKHLGSLLQATEDMNKSVSLNTSGNSNAIMNGTVKAGDLGGTATNPVNACVNGNCTIDYGDFVLNGIKEDFGEFIETAGTSGGTDSLFDLIDEIALQLQEKGDKQGFEDFRKFSNLGHFMGDIQKEYESAATSCASDANPRNCYNNLTYGGTRDVSPPTNADVSSFLTDYSSRATLGKTITSAETLSYARNLKMTDPAEFEKQKSIYASCSVIDIYDQIINEPKYSAYHDVVKKIYQNVADLSINFSANKYKTVLGEGGSSSNFSVYNAVTGDKTTISVQGSNDLTVVTNPKTSLGTDVNSALMCVTGKNYDNGDECK